MNVFCRLSDAIKKAKHKTTENIIERINEMKRKEEIRR